MQWQPGMTLESLEKEAILAAYRFYHYNKARTAAALGISVRTIDAKLAKYEGRDDRESFGGRIDDRTDGSYSEGFQGSKNQESNLQKGQATSLPPNGGVHVEPDVELSPKPSLSVQKRKKVQEVSP